MANPITFVVVPRRKVIRNYKNGTVVLQEDGWNDFGYRTLFQLYMWWKDDLHFCGNVKICSLNQNENVPIGADHNKTSFQCLEEQFCSLGQTPDYYKNIAETDKDLAINILKCLRDCAIDDEIYRKFYDLDVFRVSLLLSPGAGKALDNAKSILYGQTAKLKRSFVLDYEGSNDLFQDCIKFDFEPQGSLPHQINLLIGENGVGKTRVMSDLAFLLTMFKRGALKNIRT